MPRADSNPAAAKPSRTASDAPSGRGGAARVRRQFTLLTVLALLAGLIVALFAIQWRSFNESRRLVSHSYEVIERGRIVLRRMIDAESSQRGFLLTRDPRFLEPLEWAEREAAADYGALREIVADSGAQTARVDSLAAQWTEILAAFKRSVAAARAGAVADSLPAREAEKATMDRYRAEHASFLTAERALLEERLADLRDTEKLVNWMLGGMIVAALIALLAMMRGLFLHNRRLEAAIASEQAMTRDLLGARAELAAAVERTRGELQDASRLLAAAIASAPIVVASQDRNLVYRWLSGKSMGQTEGWFLGKSDFEILPEPARSTIIENKRAVIESGEPRSFEVSVPLGGKGNAYLITLEPTRNARDEIDGVTSVAIDITDRKQREDHIRLLMRELAHRSKNTLAVVQAMARQTAATTESRDDFLERLSARLNAFATSHSLLVEEGWRGAALGELIRAQLGHYVDLIGKQIFLEGEDIMLPPQAAQNIGLALHELATNAGKYGALSTPEGRVDISWKAATNAAGERMATLSWRESGGPPVTPPKRRGFGRNIIERTVSRAVGGKVELDFAPEGLRWRLEFPLDPDRAEAPPGDGGG